MHQKSNVVTLTDPAMGWALGQVLPTENFLHWVIKTWVTLPRSHSHRYQAWDPNPGLVLKPILFCSKFSTSPQQNEKSQDKILAFFIDTMY